MLAEEPFTAAIGTESAERVWGQHDTHPQRQAKSVLEWDTNASSHLEMTESASPVEGVCVGGVSGAGT